MAAVTSAPPDMSAISYEFSRKATELPSRCPRMGH